jgi:hypothetical protein
MGKQDRDRRASKVMRLYKEEEGKQVWLARMGLVIRSVIAHVKKMKTV